MPVAFMRFRRVASSIRTVGVVLAALTLLGATACGSAASDGGPWSFVKVSGTHLMLNGRPFYFAGINADYIPHRDTADAALDLHHAAEEGFKVVRVFGFTDSGNPAIAAPARTSGYQYWSPANHAPAYNDGPAPGLGGLDWAIYQAHRDGLRLIIPLVNNWTAYGGINTYVCWRFCTRANSTGRCFSKCFVGYHSDFFTDPTIMSWYKAWIAHVLNHVNVYTHVAYKNDPTILAWQLANEPRCDGSNPTAYPRSPSCTPDGTILPWIREMAPYVKSIDPRHLLAVGDEGFLCSPHATYYTGNCSEGDSVKYAEVPGIDLMSFHDYPMSWNQCPNVRACVAWGNAWIETHIMAADSIGKPAVLDEFGLVSGQVPVTPAEQAFAYRTWTRTIYHRGGAGDMVWSLDPSGDLGYSDPYYVSCPSASCAALEANATAMKRK